MAKHAEETKDNFLIKLLIILLLGIIIYFFVVPYFDKSNIDTSNNLEPTTITAPTTAKDFEDVFYLHSDEFNLTIENGLSTIDGKIFNNSNEVINNLNCLYSLKDEYDNVVYELSINVPEIEPQSYFGFTSAVIFDLSNVVDYSVKTIQ